MKVAHSGHFVVEEQPARATWALEEDMPPEYERDIAKRIEATTVRSDGSVEELWQTSTDAG